MQVGRHDKRRTKIVECRHDSRNPQESDGTHGLRAFENIEGTICSGHLAYKTTSAKVGCNLDTLCTYNPSSEIPVVSPSSKFRHIEHMPQVAITDLPTYPCFGARFVATTVQNDNRRTRILALNI